MKKTQVVLIALVVVGLIALGLLAQRGRTSNSPPANVNPNSLPGIQLTNAPWNPETSYLLERLQQVGLPALLKEGTQLHTHQHLDLFIDGRAVTVPAGVGIDQVGGFISPIHTHDKSGTIHIESPESGRYTLGQFFDVWGVRFTRDCIGSYCNAGDKALRVYVNGSIVGSDPRQVELEEGQEIAVTFGTTKELPDPIPSTFHAS
ncbi:MAG TPA: hypothetical protein VFG95_10665 [Nitrospiria bacterium]|nr:hypothetical protein [Nitrospiria bacterium]